MTDSNPAPNGSDSSNTEVELAFVTMIFDSANDEAVMAVLSKYLVVSRGHDGCRNMDLAASTSVPSRFVLIQKWDSIEAQQAHFDSSDMVEMAQAVTPLLSAAPTIDLLEPISVHDLN